MKPRLPRKLKKTMLTEERLFDKSMGYKARRSTMLPFMRYKYYTKLYNIEVNYAF